ncbi:MAG: hypothetical protein PVJ39_05775 [Gammaproteobacteria bacterium]
MNRSKKKPYIVYTLVLLMFAAPMAWALDTHESALEDHSKAALGDIGFSSQQGSHDIDQSDHCDHGLAHLTTLISSQPSIPNLSVSKISAVRDNPFTTISANPPYRPPIL